MADVSRTTNTNMYMLLGSEGYKARERTYYEDIYIKCIVLWVRKKKIAIVVVIVSMIAFYLTQSMFELKTAEKFSIDDVCHDVTEEQHSTNTLLGLTSLEMLGTVQAPEVESVREQDIPSPDLPQTWTEGSDGVYAVDKDWWYVAVDTPMPGVTDEMLRGWFSYANCSNKFTWWHPTDHNYGVLIDESKTFRKGGSTQRISVNISGSQYQLDMMLVEPCNILDCTPLQNVATIIAGDIITYDVGFGAVHIGHFSYTLTTNTALGYSPVLHAKYWLGKAPCARVSKHSWLGRQYQSVYEGVMGYAKGWMVKEELVRGVWVHTKEKMFVLSKLLTSGQLLEA